MRVIFIKEFYVEEMLVTIPIGQEGELVDDTCGRIEFNPPCTIRDQVNSEFESEFVLEDRSNGYTEIDMVEGVQPSFYIKLL